MKLPESSLILQNPHERDNFIEFFEEGHIYNVKGDTSFLSVTTFVHSFFETFDPDVIIQKMKKSSKWNPQNKYYNMTDDAIKQQWHLKKQRNNHFYG